MDPAAHLIKCSLSQTYGDTEPATPFSQAYYIESLNYVPKTPLFASNPSLWAAGSVRFLFKVFQPLPQSSVIL